jgi:hypothetical protein
MDYQGSVNNNLSKAQVNGKRLPSKGNLGRQALVR